MKNAIRVLALALLLSPAAAPATDWQNLLLKAALEGNVKNAREALSHGAEIDRPSSDGHTALVAAMVGGQKDMFLFLLKKGASANQPDEKGNTPLMAVATEHLDLEFAYALIYPGGADMRVENADGKTARDLAAANGYDELATYLGSPEAARDSEKWQQEHSRKPPQSSGAEPAPATATAVQIDNVYNIGQPLNRGPLHPVPVAARAPAPKSPEVPRPAPADLFFPDSAPTVPHYQALRIDAAVLEHVAGSKDGKLGLSATELNQLVAAWWKLGFRTIVLAHTERGNRFYYKPKRDYTYQTVPDSVVIKPKADPARYAGALTDGTDFLTSLLSAASRNNMKVLLGLSPSGDHFLFEELDRYASSRKPGEPDEQLLKPNLERTVAAAAEQAQDLLAQFGGLDSFTGWYLGPHALCADEVMKFHAELARKLKKLAPKKTVSVSLYADAHACDARTDLHKVLKANEDAIDTVIYEDGLGAGRIATSVDGKTRYLENQTSCDGKDCRDERLRQLPLVFASLKKSHEKTKVAYQIESQGWRRPGSCPSKEDEGFPGDCPQVSLPASWTKDLHGQFTKEAKLVADARSLLLSDGLVLFDLKVPSASSPKPDVNLAAHMLTEGYLGYLGAPKPGFTATMTGTQTATATSNQVSRKESVLCRVSGNRVTDRGQAAIAVTQAEIPGRDGMTAWEAAELDCKSFAIEAAQRDCRADRLTKSIELTYERDLALDDGSSRHKAEQTNVSCEP